MVDDYTFKMTFETPNGLLIKNLLAAQGSSSPAHYMKQFHIKYNKKEVEAAVAEAKLQDWMNCYTQRTTTRRTPIDPRSSPGP